MSHSGLSRLLHSRLIFSTCMTRIHQGGRSETPRIKNIHLYQLGLLCFPGGRLGLTRVYRGQTDSGSILTFGVAVLQFYS